VYVRTWISKNLVRRCHQSLTCKAFYKPLVFGLKALFSGLLSTTQQCVCARVCAHQRPSVASTDWYDCRLNMTADSLIWTHLLIALLNEMTFLELASSTERDRLTLKDSMHTLSGDCNSKRGGTQHNEIHWSTACGQLHHCIAALAYQCYVLHQTPQSSSLQNPTISTLQSWDQ
jgi:hypothetical protein